MILKLSISAFVGVVLLAQCCGPQVEPAPKPEAKKAEPARVEPAPKCGKGKCDCCKCKCCGCCCGK